MKLPTHWTTRDKRSIAIKDMEDSHLANTIAHLQRCAPSMQDDERECMMVGFGMLQGEMAQYYAEQELDETFEEAPDEWLERQPVYRALCREQKRRANARRRD